MNDQMRAIEAKARELIEKAESVYNISFGNVSITWYKAGLALGMASRTSLTQYHLKFSIDATAKYFDNMLNDTVAHEVAHLVGFVFGDRGHGRIWKRAAMVLGARPEACVVLNGPKLASARRTRKYIYVLPLAGEVTMTAGEHDKLQRGATYTIHKTRERLTGAHHNGMMRFD